MQLNVRKAFVSGCFGALTIFISGLTHAAENEDPDYQLMLVGGSLKTCSSMSLHNCESTDWVNNDRMRTQGYVSLTEASQKEVVAAELWPEARYSVRDETASALTTIASYLDKQNMDLSRVPVSDFQDAFRRRATRDLYHNLSDTEWNRIIDHLELPVAQGQHEQVNLAQNRNSSSLAIVSRFVELAQQVNEREKPEIVVLTSASRDPLDAVDFYLDLFQQAGANTTWLPIDAAVAAARRNDDCDQLDSYRSAELGSWQRARVHPHYHEQQLAFCKDQEQEQSILAKADAIFFNGGDQNLTRNALIHPDGKASDLLNMITRRLAENQLVVGGTSAGTAVMTAQPMITNGSSRSALTEGAVAADEPPAFGCDRDDSCPSGIHQDSLTYQSAGGLGLFPYGLLDTHFSERGRQARLMRLAAATETPLAVGVDETTALMVDLKSDQFEVIGERGVFFIADAENSEMAVASTFHYLINGSTGTLGKSDITDVTFADGQSMPESDSTASFLSDRGVIHALHRLCRGESALRVEEEDFGLFLRQDEATQTHLSDGDCQLTNGRIGVVYYAP